MRANLQKWDTLGVSRSPVPFARFGEKGRRAQGAGRGEWGVGSGEWGGWRGLNAGLVNRGQTKAPTGVGAFNLKEVGLEFQLESDKIYSDFRRKI